MTEQEIKKINQKLTDCFLFGANLKVSYFTKDLFTYKVVEEKEMTLSFIDSNVAKLKGDSRDASFCLDISGYYSRLNMEKEADEYRTKAINYFKSIIEQYPDSAEIYFLLGSTVKFNVDIEGCMNYYRKALSIHPSYSDAATMMAQKYAMVGQLDSTYNIIINHINHFPKDTAFYLSAPIYYLSKQISIIQKFQTLEEIKNYSLDSLTSMPLMERFREQYKNNPHTEYIYRVVKQVLISTFIPIRVISDTNLNYEDIKFHATATEIKFLNESKQFFESYLKRKDIPTYFYCNKLLGSIYILLDEPKKAIPYLKKTIQLRPRSNCSYEVNTEEDYYNLLSAYSIIEDSLNFEKTLLEKIKEQPTVDPSALDYIMAGDFYATQHKFEKAKKYYEKALSISKFFVQKSVFVNDLISSSLVGLAFIDYMQGNNDSAMNYINQAYKIDNKKWELFMVYGAILLKQNDIVNAYEIFKTVKQLHNRDWVDEDILNYYFEPK